MLRIKFIRPAAALFFSFGRPTYAAAELVDSISETCFQGHALLFPEDEEGLNRDNADLEVMAKSYNRSERNLPTGGR